MYGRRRPRLPLVANESLATFSNSQRRLVAGQSILKSGLVDRSFEVAYAVRSRRSGQRNLLLGDFLVPLLVWSGTKTVESPSAVLTTAGSKRFGRACPPISFGSLYSVPVRRVGWPVCFLLASRGCADAFR